MILVVNPFVLWVITQMHSHIVVWHVHTLSGVHKWWFCVVFWLAVGCIGVYLAYFGITIRWRICQVAFC